jgi:hypothetical protein
VRGKREAFNTVFVVKELESFKDYWYYKHIENIRQQRSPSSAPEYTTLLGLSKMDLLHEAVQFDKFNSDFLIWNDATFMRQFDKNLFEHENLVKKVYQLLQPQWVFFTHEASSMFAGYNGTEKYVGRDLKANDSVITGNFGGFTEAVGEVRHAYENFLRITLENGDLNSEEAVLSMMPLRYPSLIPNTLGLSIATLYQNFRIFGNVNRKPETSRYFRGSFGPAGNMTVDENWTVGVYPNRAYSVETEVGRYDRVLGHESDIHTQIFLKHLAFLVILACFYSALKFKRAFILGGKELEYFSSPQ